MKSPGRLLNDILKKAAVLKIENGSALLLGAARMESNKKMLEFVCATRALMRIRFPKQYHDKYEWEYESHLTDKRVPLILRVWKTKRRSDRPHTYTLTEHEATIVRRIMKRMNEDD